jgi:hypothetical protein
MSIETPQDTWPNPVEPGPNYPGKPQNPQPTVTR